MNKIKWCVAGIVLLIVGSCGGRGSGESVLTEASDTLREAQYLRMERVPEGYVVAEVSDPWHPGRLLQRYVLVGRDVEVPSNLPQGTVVRVPVERMAVFTGVHASIIDELGCSERIVGACEVEYLTSGNVKRQVAEGRTVSLGIASSPDIEKLISIKPDLIIASPFENCSHGAVEKLGIPVVEGADYMENTPLGRNEWIRLFGVLTGTEEKADSLIRRTRENYRRLREMAEKTEERRPVVMAERKYGGSWGVAGGDSYMAVMYGDAGADYLFSDVQGTGSVNLSFETVLSRGMHADFWLFKYAAEKAGTPTYSSLRSDFEPYSQFDAWRDRHIYACNTLLTPYYDDVVLHPDRILADLISLFHPSLADSARTVSSTRYFLPLE